MQHDAHNLFHSRICICIPSCLHATMSTASKSTRGNNQKAAAVAAAAAAAELAANAAAAAAKPAAKRGVKRQNGADSTATSAAAVAVPAAAPKAPKGKRTKKADEASSAAAVPAAAPGSADPAAAVPKKRGRKPGAAAASAATSTVSAVAAPVAAAAAPAPKVRKARPTVAAATVAAKAVFGFIFGLNTNAAVDPAAGSGPGAAVLPEDAVVDNIKALAFNTTPAAVAAITSIAQRAATAWAKQSDHTRERTLDTAASLAKFTARINELPADVWATTHNKWLSVFPLDRNISAAELAAPGFALAGNLASNLVVTCALAVYNIAVSKGLQPLGLASESSSVDKTGATEVRTLKYPVDGDRLYIDKVYSYLAYMKDTVQTPFALSSQDKVKLAKEPKPPKAPKAPKAPKVSAAAADGSADGNAAPAADGTAAAAPETVVA